MQAQEADQHDHVHAHDHAHDHAAHDRAGPRDGAAFSLLRLSAAQRMGLVLAAIAAIWAGVRWALS